MNHQELFELIRCEYDAGIYNLKEMIELVDKKIITKEEFHWITSYSYEGIKKMRGW